MTRHFCDRCASELTSVTYYTLAEWPMLCLDCYQEVRYVREIRPAPIQARAGRREGGGR